VGPQLDDRLLEALVSVGEDQEAVEEAGGGGRPVLERGACFREEQ
jgi:hypothetical protein